MRWFKIAATILIILKIIALVSYGIILSPNVLNKNELDINREYHITLWEIKLPSSNQHSLTGGIIDSFKGLYPNINIYIEYFSPVEIEKALHKALKEGNPPHIATVPFNIEFAKSSFGVPVTLSNEEKDGYHPYALEGGVLNNQFYYLPRWSEPRFLLGNKDYLNRMAVDWQRVQYSGWRLDEFNTLIGRELPKDLRIKNHIGVYDDNLLACFFPDEIKSKIEINKETLFMDFLKSYYGIIGPVGSGYTGKLRDRSYVQLPFPHDLNTPVIGGYVEGFMFFNPYPSGGKDEQLAAQTFGKFYSKEIAKKLSNELGKIPAFIDIPADIPMDIYNYVVIPID